MRQDDMNRRTRQFPEIAFDTLRVNIFSRYAPNRRFRKLRYKLHEIVLSSYFHYYSLPQHK
jgi:hypothetical protein